MTYFSFSQNAFIKIFLFSTLFIFIPKTSNAMLKAARVTLLKIYTKDLGVYEYDAENRIKAMCEYLAVQPYTSIKSTRDMKSILQKALTLGAVLIHGPCRMYEQFDANIDSFLRRLQHERHTLSYEQAEEFALLTLIDFYKSL